MYKHIFIMLLGLGLPLGTHAQQKGNVLPVKSTYPVVPTDTKEQILLKAAHTVPTANQYRALQNEFIAFIHFGPNTFTRMEWGNGMEDPKVFALKTLDTDQWCTSMKAAGMKMVIITAKHHDGFVLWQSRYTTHGIMSTPYKDGKGDILKELSASCKKHGLKLGVYLSPADLYQIENPKGLYGNLSSHTERTIPRVVPGRPFANKTTFTFKVDDYNEYFLNQLFELLTEYGPIDEVWFDGAHPKRKGNQQYDYLAWKKLIQTLAPKAVVFGKQDIRWCGNEDGATRPTEWNVIPYEQDPATMNNFADLTNATLGEREELYKGKFLHYQQAETNTSIREGWFYRDDTDQKVRSVDDVFDIYERSVGGNSTFLLNIPPNRSGRFSDEDVSVLAETGKRITATYGTNLFAKAKGPAAVLDNQAASFVLLDKSPREIVITTPAAVTINRLVLQEAVATHGERVEKHAVDAWIDGAWKEIITSTNIGYKRILRFPEVKSNQFRIRILEARHTPAISLVSAHYYLTRPPQLQISANAEGMVTIAPKENDFSWNPHGENASMNINSGTKIYYTTDGTTPTAQSTLYTQPFLATKGEVKAIAVNSNGTGSVATEMMGMPKKSWKVLAATKDTARHAIALAMDGNRKTYWQSLTSPELYINLDLGEAHQLKGFAYTPPARQNAGLMQKGIVKVSNDGVTWKEVSTFTFGNLINDPTTRRHFFTTPITARYVQLQATEIAGGGTRVAIAELDFFGD
jgi:alpha-L-fucosidase